MEKINKIVELGIDIENMAEEIFADLGVDVISIVENPAIEHSFMFFNREDFVIPNENEDHDAFIGRCMSELTSEFPDEAQRFAVCESYWSSQFEQEHPELSQEDEAAIIEYANNNGEFFTHEDIFVDMSKEEFETVADVLDGMRGAGALKRLNLPDDYEAEEVFRYQGSATPERTFCRAMMGLSSQGKYFTREQITSMSRANINSAFNEKNGGPYDVFQWVGGKFCKHYWQRLLVFKNDSGRKVIIVTNPTNRAQRNASKTWREKFPETYNQNLSQYDFKVVNEEARMIYGPVMVPNKMILRRDENGDPFYVFFSKATIKKMAEKYLEQNKLHNTDIEHDGLVTTTNKLVESWVSDSMVHDKSYTMGFTLPKGTWYVGIKVNDDQTWEDIKARRLQGFSLSGQFINRFN